MHPYLFLRREFLRSKKLACADKPFRILLALDGARMTKDMLAVAYERCNAMTRRVDVLIANYHTEPSVILNSFLDQLNQSGIEYRLTIAEYSLSSQVTRYTKRFPGIRTVVTNNLSGLFRGLGPGKERLIADGYQFVGLSTSAPREHDGYEPMYAGT